MYDLSRPLSTGGWSSRPRAYKDIPALQNLAFFAEDIATVRMGTHKLEIMGGLRALSLIGLDKRYTLNGKFYLDPRLNVQWVFPAIRVGGHDLNISLGGGVGWTTRMPTLDYLSPISIITTSFSWGIMMLFIRNKTAVSTYVRM